MARGGPEEQILEQSLKMQIPREGAFQAKRSAGAKVLRQEHAWVVCGTGEGPASLQNRMELFTGGQEMES